MPESQVQKLAPRYDAVWASTDPSAWHNAHRNMIVSNYFIMGMDRYSVLQHSLSWWKANHPNWILYACRANGSPTHDIAYMQGIDVPDMPLDIHNPAVADYQISAMAHAALASGYNALAIDQVIFWNTYKGGNRAMGQHVVHSEYGCGVWNGNTFVRRYASPSDHNWTSDVIAYTREAKRVAAANGVTLVINHPAGKVDNPDEQQLLANTDVEMDETGFSNYGSYENRPQRFFTNELQYMRYAQEHGVGFLMIDKFVNDAQPSPHHLEYAIATYLLGNEGAALLFAGGLDGYGTNTYRSEYDAPLGRPCGGVVNDGDLYRRQFNGGIAVVNAGNSPQTYRLPNGTFRDLEGRAVGNPLRVGPHDAFVLLGNGC